MPSLLHYKSMIYLKQMQLAIKILNMKEESKFTDTVYPMYLLVLGRSSIIIDNQSFTSLILINRLQNWQ